MFLYLVEFGERDGASVRVGYETERGAIRAVEQFEMRKRKKEFSLLLSNVEAKYLGRVKIE